MTTPARPIPTRRGVPRARPGFTLVELVAAVTVLGIIAAVLAPVVSAAGGAYASAVSLRRSTERAAFAMERTVQLLRETPAGAAPGTVDLALAEPGRVRFGDGRGLELESGTLFLRDATGRAPLCRDVSEFSVRYLGPDGATDTGPTPALTQRYHVALRAGGVELRAAVFVRARMTDP